MCYYCVYIGESEDYENLLLTVEALKAQLEEQTRLCKEQVSLVPHAIPGRETPHWKELQS